MSSAGRVQLAGDYNFAFQNAGTKALIGQGVGGADGWTPKWGDFLIERVFLCGADFLLAGTTGSEEVYVEVELNGTTTIYDVSYGITGPGFSGPWSAASFHSAEDTTPQIVTTSDYLCATVGQRNYSAGAVISKDVGVAIEGRYITGPLAGQGVHIGRRGVTRGFHVYGTMNGITYYFNFMGASDISYSGLGWDDAVNYTGWTVPVPMRLRRMWMFGKVTSPSISPDDNDLVLRLYVNDPSSTGTADMECLQSLNVAINTEFVKFDDSTTELAAGDELFLQLQQVRNAGTGSANLIDINAYLEWEVI